MGRSLGSPASRRRIMSEKSAPTRRSVLAATAAAAAIGLFPAHAADETNEDKAIRPFSVHVPEADLLDLRRRIAATRWPDRETVNNRSQGAELAKLQPRFAIGALTTT